MDPLSQERLAKNEAFFREVNERIREVVERYGPDDHVYEFICECANSDCAERIELNAAQYQAIRADGTRFVLAPGHELGRIEKVVEKHAEHVVVEKVGVAGEVAAALDPRVA